MLAKSSSIAGRLFQIFTTRLQRKYFWTSTRLWHTNNLQVCPRVVSLGLTVKNLDGAKGAIFSQTELGKFLTVLEISISLLNFPKRGFSTSDFVFLEKNLATKRRLSDKFSTA